MAHARVLNASSLSPLQVERLTSGHTIPSMFAGLVQTNKECNRTVTIPADIQEQFPNTHALPYVEFQPSANAVGSQSPLKVGVVLSGGQAPGGHNVIAGIFDYLKKLSPDSQMFGFSNGPHGIFSAIYQEVTPATIDKYRNTGGFDMLGSGRHKIESPEQFAASLKTATELDLDGLVVIGGDDSNTNAAVLGEYFRAKGSKCKVVGCPKTIDGDLKNSFIPISFGFDTACRTYSEQVGNVQRDAISSQKYYHFVRLMGRSASHIALEVALQCRPNICFIGEEVAQNKQSLSEVTAQIADMVEARAAKGMHYGVVLLPEGLIEFIPEIGTLIHEVNDVLAKGAAPTEEALLHSNSGLSPSSQAVFQLLPHAIRQQLLLDRDPHGNVQVAKIETEQLLASTTAAELKRRLATGGISCPFVPRYHAFGYEGRSALPSVFDSTYCYALGLTASALIQAGFTSLMSTVANLLDPVEEWRCGGVPIPMMMGMEKRHGKMKPVISKALVELDGSFSGPYKAFCARRATWLTHDLYRCPGPLQFHGPTPSLVPGPKTMDGIPLTLKYELSAEDPDPSPDVTAAEYTVTKFPLGDTTGGKQFLHRPGPPSCVSEVEAWRQPWAPEVPKAIQGYTSSSSRIVSLGSSQCMRPKDRKFIASAFPKTLDQVMVELVSAKQVSDECSVLMPTKKDVKVGIVFCARQAPGAHNVISGLYDSVSSCGGKLVGFVGGTEGLLKGQSIDIDEAKANSGRNCAGLDLLGRTVDKIRCSDAPQIDAVCKKLGVTALILVGGARTQTDAAYLAEELKGIPSNLCVIGVPCGIDGSLQSSICEASIGFDSACYVYSQLVGNICTDAASARKYYHFLRVMGADASHVALEVGLRTRPNYVLIAEEVAHKRQSLHDVTMELADLVQRRSEEGKDFGVILLPEAVATAIPELDSLMDEVGEIMKTEGRLLCEAEVKPKLTPWSLAVFTSLPDFMREAVLAERQSNMAANVSQIETERLLADLVAAELDRRKAAGQYKGKFSPIPCFLGYQARGSLPSNFDCELAYSLGVTAAELARHELTGYLAIATGVNQSSSNWRLGGLPLTTLLIAEDVSRPAITAAKVDLTGRSCTALNASRATWAVDEYYTNPGPLQLGGPTADSRPLTLVLQDDPGYIQRMYVVNSELEAVRKAVQPGCPSTLLQVAAQSLGTLTDIMGMFHGSDLREYALGGPAASLTLMSPRNARKYSRSDSESRPPAKKLKHQAWA